MPSGENDLDLNTIIQEERFQPVAEEIVRARQVNEDKDAKLNRSMKVWSFWVATVVLCIFIIGGFTIMMMHPDDDMKKWAQNIVTPIVTGVIGYAFGKGGSDPG